MKYEWKLNTLNVNAELGGNELKMGVDMESDAIEMLEKAGLRDIKGFVCRTIMGTTHEMGHHV